jgi:hypothetical protein
MAKKITVLASKMFQEICCRPVGESISRTENGGILVACGSKTVLELLRYCRVDGSLLWFAEDLRFAPGLVLQ